MVYKELKISKNLVPLVAIVFMLFFAIDGQAKAKMTKRIKSSKILASAQGPDIEMKLKPTKRSGKLKRGVASSSAGVKKVKIAKHRKPPKKAATSKKIAAGGNLSSKNVTAKKVRLAKLSLVKKSFKKNSNKKVKVVKKREARGKLSASALRVADYFRRRPASQ